MRGSDLQPWQPASKIFRLGRNGPGIHGEAAGSPGAGDLTRSMIDCEPPWHLLDSDPYPSYTDTDMGADPTTYRGHYGHQRTRIYGPADYHRILAFGVPVFQVDWSDGRRKDGKLVFYPGDCRPSNQYGWDAWSHYWKRGPGEICMFAWNSFSPEQVRAAYIRGSKQTANYASYSNLPYSASTSGCRDIGRTGWPWPKALRLRIVLLDLGADPPMGYQFSQVFTLLAQ
jgi:hypothetical protein